MRRVSVVLVAISVAATLMLFAVSALAAPGSPSFEVSPTTAHNLEVVKATGKGCGKGARVHILFDGKEIAGAWANKNGEFAKNVRIPAKASTGEHTMSASCDDLVLGSVKVQVKPVHFNVSPRSAWSLQVVKTWGSGCEKGAKVQILFDGKLVASALANKKGEFTRNVRIPGSATTGKHWLSASCDGRFLGSRSIKVQQAGFSVSPRLVEAGDTIAVFGFGCQPKAYVVITLDGKVIGDDRANDDGEFRETVQIPVTTKPGRHWVGATCDGRFIGSRSIQVVQAYPARTDLMSVSRSAVPAGQAVTVSGTDCPGKAPTASLDGQPVALTLDKTAKGKGFTATATIPAEAAPGKHQLTTACDAGSAGTTELNVLDPATTEPAVSRQAFAPKPVNDLAIWAGLLAGVALLVASTRVGSRRRRS